MDYVANMKEIVASLIRRRDGQESDEEVTEPTVDEVSISDVEPSQRRKRSLRL